MLAEAVQSYLSVRRATGFDLKLQGNFLKSFTTFSEAKGKHYVCSETAIEWAGSSRSVLQRARRLGAVIRFARYIRMENQRHQVPPADPGTSYFRIISSYLLRINMLTIVNRSRVRTGCGFSRTAYLFRFVPRFSASAVHSPSYILAGAFQVGFDALKAFAYLDVHQCAPSTLRTLIVKIVCQQKEKTCLLASCSRPSSQS